MSTVYPATERVCRECRQSKPLTEFYPKGSGRHGRSARCKDCMRAKQRRSMAAVRGLSEEERDAAYERFCARRDDRAALALIGQARCPICKQAKPLAQFYPDPSQSSGHDCRCKDCARARTRHYHWDPAMPRKGKGPLRLFPLDKTCPHCGKRKSLYDFGCLDHAPYGHGPYCRACNCAMTSAEWHAHPERRPTINARRRVRYRTDDGYRSGVLRRARAWYVAHTERSLAAKRAWVEAHPEQYRFTQRRSRIIRRRREGQMVGEHSLTDLHMIREAQRNCCAYCLAPLARPYHVDHMTAVARGGSDWPWNLCLSCPRCNTRKQAKDAGQFLAQLIKERQLRARNLVVRPLNPPLTRAKAK